MKIISLSEQNTKEAVKLINEVFHPNPNEFDAPIKFLPASLHPESEGSKKLYKSYKLNYLKYYVGVERGVVGVTGLFLIKRDKDSAWLAWYCVSPKSRGKGFGKELLEFIIRKAKSLGKKHLKVYTSPNEGLENAMRLYQKLGFNITTMKRFGTKKIIYLKKDI